LRFGQYLVRRAYVDANAIVAALDLQRERTLPFGKVRLQKNLLNMKQVFAILNAQVDSSRRLVRSRWIWVFCARRRVDELRLTQQKLRPPLAELLVELGAIQRTQLAKALREFLSGQNQTP